MTALQTTEKTPVPPVAEFTSTLGRLNHALERASRRLEADSGVTAQQRALIRCIGKYPGMTLGQLATQVHVDPATVSVAIDRLEQRGLVERRRADRDRRRVMLGLTAAGRAIDGGGTAPSERALERLFETMPTTDLDCAQRVLASLAGLIEREL